MEFERVINGIVKYIDHEIYSGMNDWQEMLARIAVSRVLNNKQNIKEALKGNAFIKTFGIMDDSGNVDIEGLIRDIRTQIERKGTFEIAIPMFGKFSFSPSDVDTLRKYIIAEGSVLTE